MNRLYNALFDYEKENYYPCHMPGHKRKDIGGLLSEVLKYDITEIDGFDNLHDAKDLILEAERSAAKLYHSDETHFLINGSTVGVLSSILGVTDYGDDILICRNCHKSVYNAVAINNLKCHYLYPQINTSYGICGNIEPNIIKEILSNNNNIKAVVIVSPTYDGVILDVKEIAQIVHSYGKILIVDEAHGAHLGLSDTLPASSVENGADLVIHSLHKTLPAPTQTALLHINGTLVNREKVRRNLTMYQSSSPSYLLMAGIDYCIELLENNRNALFSRFADNLHRFLNQVNELKEIMIIDKNVLDKEGKIYGFDTGKILVSTRNHILSGKQLYDKLLNDYHIQPEMAAGSYCLLMMTVMDDEDGFDRVVKSLKSIDEELIQLKCDNTTEFNNNDLISHIIITESKCLIREALDAKHKSVLLDEAIDKISGDFISVYPPGIPLIVPGEIITNDIKCIIYDCLKKGLNVQGIRNEKEINIIWEKSFTY